jgi:hypothetical protein
MRARLPLHDGQTMNAEFFGKLRLCQPESFAKTSQRGCVHVVESSVLLLACQR